jgi:hypothetical protein
MLATCGARMPMFNRFGIGLHIEEAPFGRYSKSRIFSDH